LINKFNPERPLIVDIKQNSLDDGPGIRTVLFLKGCALQCVWCQNPEAQNPDYELIFNSKNCIYCNKCFINCEAISFSFDIKTNSKQINLDRNICNLCFNCVNLCPAEVFKIAGKYYEIGELVELILSNFIFYKNTGGGITLSGGEPLLFPKYIKKFISILKQKFMEKFYYDLSICIETAGQFYFNDDVIFILKNSDLIFYDIKIMDSSLHKRFCGVENSLILNNFKTILNLDFIRIPENISELDFKQKNSINKNTLLVPRMPLIPEITLTKENIIAFKQFMIENKIKIFNFLPYNPLWSEKSIILGKKVLYERKSWLSKEEKQIINEVFNSEDLNEKFSILTYKI